MTLEPEEMSVVEHLTELRRRIIYVLIVFVVGLIGGLFVAKPIYLYLIHADHAQVLCCMPSLSGMALACT